MTLEELEIFNAINAAERHCRIGKVLMKRRIEDSSLDRLIKSTALNILVFSLVIAASLLAIHSGYIQ